MNWGQALLTKLNRSKGVGGARNDEYHMLTDAGVADGICLRIANKIKRMPKPVALLIERDAKRLVVGYSDYVGSVLGEGHPYAREFDFGDTTGERRAIRFTHAYFNEGSKTKVPCHREMLAAQRGHLEHILTEAHAGREPVSMPATVFSKLPDKGTDWHRIAKEVEAGKCRGGLFNLDGSLIERFENLAETVGKEAQKKTTSFAERVAKTPAAPTGCRPGFTTIAAVSLGAVAMGWAAWHLMRNNGQTQPQATQATQR